MKLFFVAQLGTIVSNAEPFLENLGMKPGIDYIFKYRMLIFPLIDVDAYADDWIVIERVYNGKELFHNHVSVYSDNVFRILFEPLKINVFTMKNK